MRPAPTLPLLAVLALASAALPLAPAQGGDALLVEAPLDDAPAWWTPEVRARAHEAGLRGLAYDRALGLAVDPADAFDAPPIRPGVKIRTNVNCTAAFVFGNATTGERDHIATAAHCTGYVGQPVYAFPSDTVSIYIGNVSSRTPSLAAGDWALIDVFDDLEDDVDPDVLVIGGPCARAPADAPDPAAGRLVKHVGHGSVFQGQAPPRVGVLVGHAGAYVEFVGLTNQGDSGSPILLVGDPAGAGPGCAEGVALGILSGHVANPCPAPLERCDLILPCGGMTGFLCPRKRMTHVSAIPASEGDLMLGNGLPT